MQRLVEEGVVVAAQSTGRAVVELKRTASCRSCAVCSQSPEGKLRLEAVNPLGADVGDRVRCDIKTKGLVGGIVMLYLAPALGLVFGIVAVRPAQTGLAVGIALMLGCFLVARCYGKKRLRSQVEIIEVIKQ